MKPTQTQERPAMAHDENAPNLLPRQFSDLKKELWNDALLQTWTEVLAELDASVAEISASGGEVSTLNLEHYLSFSHGCFKLIPRVPYADIVTGLSDEQIKYIKKIGVVVITGGIPKEVRFWFILLWNLHLISR